jgi:hypothetical protein
LELETLAFRPRIDGSRQEERSVAVRLLGAADDQQLDPAGDQCAAGYALASDKAFATLPVTGYFVGAAMTTVPYAGRTRQSAGR